MSSLEITGVGAGAAAADGSAMADVAREASLDSLVGPSLNASQTNAELGDLGKQVLEYGVSNPFLNGEISVRAAPEGGLIDGASRDSVNMLGGAGATEGNFDDPRMNNLVDTMKEMYLESAKTLLAWNIVQQVSKDTKIMLQAQ
ncbi:MAG: hypothetical protein QNJ44_22830 [Rhodobacter sp.]|nr:hypothetical protein [Rhodobacter sp.]